MKFLHEWPRFTSYPAVTKWSKETSSESWHRSLESALLDDPSLALYIHLPFCESLCSFCGCNTTITKNHEMESRYLDLLEKEWSYYKLSVPRIEEAKIRQIYVGGGSPNFLSAKSLRRLFGFFHNLFAPAGELDAVIEFDPRKLHQDQLAVCHDEGFTGVSFGIEDLNLHVQSLINRVQSLADLEKAVAMVRGFGFSSLAFDLIYGLPNQGVPEIQLSINKSLELAPDRVAIYSLATGPWLKSHQNVYGKATLLEGEQKEQLRLEARKIFLQKNYKELGLDHYVKEDDIYWQAQKAGKLHKNFSGYSSQKTACLLGLGVSAISETSTSYFQNEKVLNLYERQITKNESPGFRGLILSQDEVIAKKCILDLQTQFKTRIDSPAWQKKVISFLNENAQTVEVFGGELRIDEDNRPLVRMACQAIANCVDTP